MNTPATPRSLRSATKDQDSDEVDAAERRMGSVLEGLEADTGGRVRDIELEDVVDTDQHGRPVLKKKVEIAMEPRQVRHWSR